MIAVWLWDETCHWVGKGNLTSNKLLYGLSFLNVLNPVLSAVPLFKLFSTETYTNASTSLLIYVSSPPFCLNIKSFITGLNIFFPRFALAWPVSYIALFIYSLQFHEVTWRQDGHRNTCSMTQTVFQISLILSFFSSSHSPALPWQVVHGADSLFLQRK